MGCGVGRLGGIAAAVSLQGCRAQPYAAMQCNHRAPMHCHLLNALRYTSTINRCAPCRPPPHSSIGSEHSASRGRQV